MIKIFAKESWGQPYGPKSDYPWLSGSAIESPAACHLGDSPVNGEWIRIVRINWQSDGRAENPSVISKWES
jgi:hypothetical protein